MRTFILTALMILGALTAGARAQHIKATATFPMSQNGNVTFGFTLNNAASGPNVNSGIGTVDSINGIKVNFGVTWIRNAANKVLVSFDGIWVFAPCGMPRTTKPKDKGHAWLNDNDPPSKGNWTATK